ncbi:MAG TPA: ABC transporter ATP-binding protein [Segeticoccus sp.]|uniref:ABC transporter ATP-binding protein n=1 Tax=Segeticoccus sp. TaxID=2706531 RepID=UPI002D7F5F87|nr:ABC transporter ATP-binding protein [Segeticoccus sp.]HET8599068.1 ABC transporter ATP-binding protein [Segeticoccus sp.]
MSTTMETPMPQSDAALPERPPGPDTAIELSGVVKDYQSRRGEGFRAVQNLDLTIGAGEFFSLLGPSGCGKTTTLRMIAGFEEATEGRVLLYGQDVTTTPPNKRDVNMVFQSYALFPHMDIFSNVAFGLRRHKVPKEEIRARVQEALEMVEMGDLGKRRPTQLSGGQQQRVALARALVNRPRALLLDEPLGALDLKLRQTMQIELKRIQREVGITFVYVTHDQGEALTMSDRVAVMNRGRIEQLGTPEEIYERPATKFTAGFIGTSNILAGQVDRLDGDHAVLDYGDSGRVLVPRRLPVATGDRIELTVRPEKISLVDEPLPRGCALRGSVKEVVYLGTSTNYTVATAAGSDVVVFQQNSATFRGHLGRGDDVWLSWEPDHSYLLTDSGAGPRAAALEDSTTAG